jgi:hypothetical protein
MSAPAGFHRSPVTEEMAVLLKPRNAQERAWAVDYIYDPRFERLSVEKLQWMISSFLCGYRSADGDCSCGGHT